MKYRILTKDLNWLNKLYREKEFFSTEIHQYVINILSKCQLTACKNLQEVFGVKTTW